jgi:hypothetical protein
MRGLGLKKIFKYELYSITLFSMNFLVKIPRFWPAILQLWSIQRILLSHFLILTPEHFNLGELANRSWRLHIPSYPPNRFPSTAVASASCASNAWRVPPPSIGMWRPGWYGSSFPIWSATYILTDIRMHIDLLVRS